MPDQQAVRQRRRSRRPPQRPWQRAWARLGKTGKTFVGLVPPVVAVIGTLLALGVIHPFGKEGNALAAAVGQVTDAGTADGSLTVEVLSKGKTLRQAAGGGTFDFRKGEFRESLDSHSGAVTGHADLIYTPPVMFQRVTPSRLQPLPGGKQWLAVDLGALQVAKAPSEFGILGFGENDPSQFLEYLRSSGNVKKIGTETVFGVPTTHYAADIDPAKVLGSSAAKGAASSATAVQHEEAWIDAAGLVRRIKADYRVGSAEFIETLDFSNFGTAVALAAPPDAQTADLTALLRGIVPPGRLPALSHHTIAAAAWARRADEICGRVLRAERQLVRPRDPALLSAWVRSLIEIAERGTSSLAQLPLPAGGELLAVQLVRNSARQADYAKAFLLAIDFGTTADVRRIQRRLVAMDAQFNEIARKLGADVCAQSA
jgi:hypothetical protein